MLRRIRQIVQEEQDFSSTDFVPTSSDSMETSTVPLLVLSENQTNGSMISAFSSSSSSTSQGSLWSFQGAYFLACTLGSISVSLILVAGIWCWYQRTYRSRRQHSLPLAVNDFIETKKLQEKRLSSGPIISTPNRAPPVPPRPTAYTTMLGQVEYRSNL